MPSPPIVRTPLDLRARLRPARARGLRLALVPTMGALHEGHLSLVRLAHEHADLVAVSLFVNPAQFAPTEDFDAYPRDEAKDAGLLALAGCDLVYAPTRETIYPLGFATTVSVAGVATPLDGVSRPGHFAGVATVVAKLLVQAAPDVAVFGEKDYQQLQVIRRLVLDLDLPVWIIGAPIVRDADGLALSSRNAYLTAAQRAVAPVLHRTLSNVAQALASGERVAKVEASAIEALMNAGFDSIDYLEVRTPDDLARLGPGPLTASGRILAAVTLGRTRLIDNVAAGRSAPIA